MKDSLEHVGNVLKCYTIQNTRPYTVDQILRCYLRKLEYDRPGEKYNQHESSYIRVPI